MWNRKLVVLMAVSLLLAGGVLYVPSGLADPPWERFGSEVPNSLGFTIFAPIERDGPPIGLELVAKGLTAPLKGVAAPGLPSRLFVIDQPGQIYAIDLTADRPVDCAARTGCTLFFDVEANLPGPGLVELGCVPLQTNLFGGSFDERGLLGLAFHRDFQSNGKFYTYTSEKNSGAPTFSTTLPIGTPADHQNVIREWVADNPTDGSPGASHSKELIRVDWPQFNHDGGDLAIRASDGTLFISMGDGGGADDRDGQDFVDCGSGDSATPPTASAMVGHGDDGNGQKLDNPLGKILRIDVDGNNSGNGQYGIPADNPFAGVPDVVQEIFAFGFRNPYRMSFDKEDPDHFYVGNVGQNDIEEVELVESGANHGWPIKEGTLFFDHNGNDQGFATPDDPGTVAVIPPDLVDPVSQYDTHHEGHAVVFGFLYRGNEVPALRGRVVFGDFSHIFRFPIGPQDYGRLFIQNRVRNPGGGLERIEELRIVPGNQLNLALLGWGEDAAGELYPMGNISGLPFFDEGRVLKIVPAPEALDVD